ncbi:MAG TPA: menaquinone biosynthesis protein [Terrimicrobiaceae bacterium]
MSSFDSALAGLRIGPVSYLNSKPLIWGLHRALLDTDVPAALSRKFFAGELDIALLPVFEILLAGGARIVDNVAIACHGEVYSVIVASRTAFERCETIYLDPASRSSSALLRVLVAEYYPEGPLIAASGAVPEDGARLLIGDAAIEFRRRNGAAWRYHDLGLLWQQHTGLPFVFAVWAVSTQTNPAVFNALRVIKAQGLAARRQIALQESDPEFALHYLTDCIRYDAGNAEKMGIRWFESLSRRHGLLPRTEPANLDFC